MAVSGDRRASEGDFFVGPTAKRNDDAFTDPRTVAGTAPTDPTGLKPAPDGGRPRGRPPGSKNRTAPAEKAAAVSPIESVASILAGIHITLAAATGAPEWGMDAEEAQAIARAFADMQRHYGGVLSTKTIDTLHFVGVVIVGYGGRAVRIRARKRARPAIAQGAPAAPQTRTGPAAPPGSGGGSQPSAEPGLRVNRASPAPQGELPNTDGVEDTDDLLTGFRVMGTA